MNNKFGKLLRIMNAQIENEAVAEDAATLQDQTQAVMEIPTELVHIARKLIAKHCGNNTQPNQEP
ncbi:MAG TPA: hypothetical protein PKY50_03345 [Candidatus Competibacter sp.]|nr:hypothetical protein [Candidatus Competibacter sp.]